MKKSIFYTFIILFSCSRVPQKELLEGHSEKQHHAYTNKVMIATQGEYSSRAGLQMLRQGGNIFDAAAAISFAISVERPQSTGLGGGGFMLLDGPGINGPLSIDFREMAPEKSTEKMYLDKKGEEIKGLSLNGALASGVPGLVKGVLEMQKKYGKLSRLEVLKPAIKLAKFGFLVYPHLADALEKRKDVLTQYPAAVKIFFKDGRPLKVGEHLVQKDLAETLRKIAIDGGDAFYRGEIAKAIASEFKKRQGLITLKDLKNYKTVWRKPIHGQFKDYDIYSMAPPSSGGTHVIEILNLLEPHQLSQFGALSEESIHWMASAMNLAFIDRARYLGDSDFVQVPYQRLSSKKYAQQLQKYMTPKFNELEMKDLPDANLPIESSDTTHFSIMDVDGNVVVSTQTINYLMGSGLVVPGTGIVMNDEMDDFSTKPGASNVFGAIGSRQNRIQPRKRPLSSMSPTIVKKDNQTVLALGTPSGTRILTCVAQVIVNYLEFNLPLYRAVTAGRLHQQWQPRKLYLEDVLFRNKDLVSNLEKRGHTVEQKDLGCKIQAIALEDKTLNGVSDIRGEGLAVGF
ncbi:MAG: gamma-glutamyltransferase [Halobacteriovoraceae bacterium]|nr:gamma-glutamyltransferase [Halobacteriovoraceae bacterium]MCB9095795.1 gamma-glutamyltransferase [Halobacteriovoraceae bacterium]